VHREGCGNIPYPLAIYITSRLFFQEAANFLYLCTARLYIKKQIAEFARIRLHIDGTLGGPRVALQDQDLMLGPTFLLERMHDVRIDGLRAVAATRTSRGFVVDSRDATEDGWDSLGGCYRSSMGVCWPASCPLQWVRAAKLFGCNLAGTGKGQAG